MALQNGTIEICSDRELMALALERVVMDRFRCQRCSAEHLDALQSKQENERPLAIVVDLQNGLRERLRKLARSLNGLPIVAWQRSAASEPSLNALDAGAAGVLNDCSSAEDVLACLQAVTCGQRWVPSSVTRAALNTRRCRLSRREGQLLSLIAQGLRNKEIAFALNISEGTVKVYLSRLFSKVGVSDRYELALLGLRHGGQESAEPAGAGKPGPGITYEPLPAVYVCRDMSNPGSMDGRYSAVQSRSTLH